jgi:hypothetical protein
MAPNKRHGSVLFEVEGLGMVRRDFVVDQQDHFSNNVKRLAPFVFEQIRLLDPTLPKSNKACRPKLLDVVGAGKRRIYNTHSWALVFEEQAP